MARRAVKQPCAPTAEHAKGMRAALDHILLLARPLTAARADVPARESKVVDFALEPQCAAEHGPKIRADTEPPVAGLVAAWRLPPADTSRRAGAASARCTARAGLRGGPRIVPRQGADAANGGGAEREAAAMGCGAGAQVGMPAGSAGGWWARSYSVEGALLGHEIGHWCRRAGKYVPVTVDNYQGGLNAQADSGADAGEAGGGRVYNGRVMPMRVAGRGCRVLCRVGSFAPTAAGHWRRWVCATPVVLSDAGRECAAQK
jgi:hypothetical protein